MDIIQRLKSTSEKYGNVIAVLYCVGGIYPILSYSYQLNAPFWFTFKYIGSFLLVSILVLGIMEFRKLGWILSIAASIERIMILGLLCLMSTGYVLIINSSIGTQLEICFAGEVIEKKAEKQSGLMTTFVLSFKEGGDTKRIIVSKQEFKSHDVGGHYSKCWTKGVLGLLYN